jgi:NADH-quinone oxidoreductase subunit N
LVVLGILMSAVSLYYYLIVLKHVYVLPAKDNNPLRASGPVNVALGLLALGVVALGVWPDPILALLKLLVSRL